MEEIFVTLVVLVIVAKCIQIAMLFTSASDNLDQTPEDKPSRAEIAIEIMEAPGGTAVFIAIHNADIEIIRDDTTEISLCQTSLDVHLGSLDRRITFVTYPSIRRPES